MIVEYGLLRVTENPVGCYAWKMEFFSRPIFELFVGILRVEVVTSRGFCGKRIALRRRVRVIEKKKARQNQKRKEKEKKEKENNGREDHHHLHGPVCDAGGCVVW